MCTERSRRPEVRYADEALRNGAPLGQATLAADAVHAVLAIESGCERVTADTDFPEFAPPLR
jgi:predicted nucleic acid-binding protein